jgi:MFS family permease
MAESEKPASFSTRRSLESFNWNVSLRSVFDTVCGMSGFVFVTFTLALGIPKERLGVIASIASFACLFQMLGLMALEKIGDKKTYTIRLGVFEPLLLIVSVLLLPVLPVDLRFPVLCIAVFTTAAALNLTRPITDDWLASTIPESVRGSYLGKRMQISSLILIVALAGSGVLARELPKDNPSPYALFLTAGALFGILAAFALRRAHLPHVPGRDSFSWSAFPGILRNKLFRGCLLVNIVYNIPFWFAMPFYQVFYLRVLHMSEVAIAGMLGVYYLFKILVSPSIGRWINRFGSRSIIFWITIPYVYLFFSFTLCTPERTWPLWLGWIGASLADAAFTLTLTSVLYESVPRAGPRRSYFVANNLVLFAVGGVLTAFATGLAEALKNRSLDIGPWHLGQFHLLYLLCAVALIPFGFGSAFFLPRRHKKA